MAMQTAQSGLARKYGGRLDAAVKAHAADETDFGFQQLPPGIRNGVAEVTKCYFDEYKSGTNKGEYYLRMEAVVLSPVMHRLPDGSMMKIAGMTTSIMRPMCETKNSEGKITPQDANVAEAMNEFRKLGVETAQVQTGADLEVLAAAADQAVPPIRTWFSTSERVPRPGTNDKPGVWENWNGSKGLEDWTPPEDAAAGVVDETRTPESVGAVATNGHHSTATRPVAAAGPASLTQPGAYSDEGSINAADVDALVEKAESGDNDAANDINDMAKKLGVFDQTKDLQTWAEAGEVIKAALTGDVDPTASTDEAQAEDSPPPAKPDPTLNSTYKYKPMVKGPGGRQVQAKKAADVQVLKVDKAKRTVDLKNLSDPKAAVIKGVSWDSLE